MLVNWVPLVSVFRVLLNIIVSEEIMCGQYFMYVGIRSIVHVTTIQLFVIALNYYDLF